MPAVYGVLHLQRQEHDSADQDWKAGNRGCVQTQDFPLKIFVGLEASSWHLVIEIEIS